MIISVGPGMKHPYLVILVNILFSYPKRHLQIKSSSNVTTSKVYEKIIHSIKLLIIVVASK